MVGQMGAVEGVAGCRGARCCPQPRLSREWRCHRVERRLAGRVVRGCFRLGDLPQLFDERRWDARVRRSERGEEIAADDPARIGADTERLTGRAESGNTERFSVWAELPTPG